MANEKELVTKMALDFWNTSVGQMNKLLHQLSDEQLLQEIAPGRNRGIYLLGHLTAAHDKLFRLLGIGDPIFPSYEKIFLESPDKAIPEIPCVNEIRQSWANVNIQLSKHFSLMHPNEWFHQHASVSQEDFEKEPHHNKLNILLVWNNHLSYHFGQMILLKAKVVSGPINSLR